MGSTGQKALGQYLYNTRGPFAVERGLLCCNRPLEALLAAGLARSPELLEESRGGQLRVRLGEELHDGVIMSGDRTANASDDRSLLTATALGALGLACHGTVLLEIPHREGKWLSAAVPDSPKCGRVRTCAGEAIVESVASFVNCVVCIRGTFNVNAKPFHLLLLFNIVIIAHLVTNVKPKVKLFSEGSGKENEQKRSPGAQPGLLLKGRC